MAALYWLVVEGVSGIIGSGRLGVSWIPDHIAVGFDDGVALEA